MKSEILCDPKYLETQLLWSDINDIAANIPSEIKEIGGSKCF